MNVNDLDLFSDFSRDDAMATNFMAKFRYIHSFGRAAFENGLQHRHSDSQMFNGNTVATFCGNMMKISLVTPEITRVTMNLFG